MAVLAAAAAALALGLMIALGVKLWTSLKPSPTAGPSTTISTTTTACPSLTLERRACPWTPEGYAVEPCGPGFCWDGGPQGSLACKQEEDVPNSGRTYTSDLVCNEGYVAERDPCTNVILRCVPQ